MLEKDDVVVGPSLRDPVPNLLQRLLKIVGVDGHFEEPDVVGLADLGLWQRCL